MATNYAALCTDFYVNQKLALKLEMPTERETVIHFFDRIRQAEPGMNRLRTYPDELALESPRREGQYQWMALQRQSLRSGVVNPDDLNQAYALHRLILEVSPWFLTISPLEIDALEVLFGFDFECKANHNQIVREALMDNAPLSRLLDWPESRALDVQPAFGMALSPRCDLQAWFEVKTRTRQSEVRRERYRTEPLSVFMTLRRLGPFDSVEQLPAIFNELTVVAEKLAEDRLLPLMIQPISRAIIGSV